MKPKKIWMLSMIIASIFTILFYAYLSSGEEQTTSTPTNKTETIASAQKKETNEEPAKPKEKLKISPDKRALSIEVTHVKGVSGLIRPGNIVDIIAYIPESTYGPSTTEILLQEIKVLAVGSQTEKTIKSIEPTAELTFTYPTVTVEVTPEQALAITTVSVKGSLTMMLRHNATNQQKGETTDDN
jgi:pilus assembly protein CpaB